MSEKYIEMLKNFCATFSNSIGFETIIESFDSETSNVLEYISENEKQLNFDNWMKLYKDNYNNQFIIFDIMRNQNKPDDVTKHIVCDLLDRLPTTPTMRTNEPTKDDILNILLKGALCCKLPKDLQYNIFDLQKSDAAYYIFGNIELVHPSAIDAFSEYVIENIEEYAYDGYIPTFDSRFYDFLNQINDKEKLYNLIDKINEQGFNTHFEKIRSFIINNPVWDLNNDEDVETIDNLFRDGCQYSTLKNFTPEIINYFVNNFTNIEYPSSFADTEKFHILENIIRLKGFPSAMEYDLAMKFMSVKQTYLSKYSNNLLVKIFENTKNPDIISKLNYLGAKDRRLVLSTNKNIPTEVYSQVANEHFKNLYKGKNMSLSDLDKYALNGKFRDEDYRYVIKAMIDRDNEDFTLNKRINLKEVTYGIAISLFTPKEILEEIIEKSTASLNDYGKKFDAKEQLSYTNLMYYFDCLAYNFFARLNLAEREGLITADQFECFKHFCDRVYRVQTIPDHLTDLKFRPEIYCSDPFGSPNNLYGDKLNLNTSKEYEDMVSVLSTVFNTEETNHEIVKNLNKSFCDALIEVVTHFYDKKYIENNKNYAEYTDSQLIKAFNEFENLSEYSAGFSFESFYIIDFYKKLPEEYNKYIGLKKELLKRHLKISQNHDKINNEIEI